MTFKDKIEQSLELIQELEEQFRHTRKSEILPLSFFSSSYDIIKELSGTLHFLEQEQLKTMEQHLVRNQDSFLETSLLMEKKEEKIKPETNEIPEEAKEEQTSSEKTDKILEKLPSSEEELMKDSFFPPVRSLQQETVLLTDLQKYMSLNDKFRFQRELFNGSAEEMNKAFDLLNTFETLDETMFFIEEQVWNTDDEIALEFKAFIEKRFS